MKIFGDYHLHTKWSRLGHGKNTIDEMAECASKLGLSEIAITDHGPGHWFFGVRRKDYFRIREEIQSASKKHGIKILFGIEANLVGKNGKIDISPDERKIFDFCLMGFHRVGFGSFWDFLAFGLWKNLFGKFLKKSNTKAYVNAINKNEIDVIVHPKQSLNIDVVQVAKAAAKKGTMIEISGRHQKLTKEEIQQMLKIKKLMFIVNSDAHSKENLADVENALAFAKECKIPASRIFNLKKPNINI